MYRIRFNLGRGINYMKWKVTNPHGEHEYYNPKEVSILGKNCKLRNQPRTAEKIFNGANKSVCAWIDCKSVKIVETTEPLIHDIKASYNPKKMPYWVIDGENADNKEFLFLTTFGREVFIENY